MICKSLPLCIRFFRHVFINLQHNAAHRETKRDQHDGQSKKKVIKIISVCLYTTDLSWKGDCGEGGFSVSAR